MPKGDDRTPEDTDRLSRIRENCCEALDKMRAAACLTSNRDHFGAAIHGAIVEIALTLDALGSSRPTSQRHRISASERRAARRPRRVR